MSLPANLLGIFFALTSAFVWGTGDFSGGIATRRSNQFQVLALSALSGILALVVLAGFRREPLPGPGSIVWSMLAGASGALGIACLYRALTMGYTATVAPAAAVVGAILPVGFGFVTEGSPDSLRLAGFGLALIGIWLVSQAKSKRDKTREFQRAFLLAILAGTGFGGFFIFIAQVEAGLIFTPLLFARAVTLLTAIVLLKTSHVAIPKLASNSIAWLAGLLDVGGNIFFLLARQYTRLDIAAVLAALYPATTVILARLVLKERVSPTQGLGVAFCLAAIMLITV